MEVSGFLSQIIEAHNNLEQEQSVHPQYNFCKVCHHHIEAGEYCADCLIAKDRGYQISELTGRCRTGSDQTGTRWHARLIVDDQPSYKALCGYAPKGSSAGWSDWCPEGREVTCPKCLKKLKET